MTEEAKRLPAWQRPLATARLVGACALGIVAQIAVDMPQGHFGPLDQVTAIGAGYALILALLAAFLVATLRHEPRATAWLIPVIHALNVGLFLPALMSDPVISGIVVLWNLLLLARHFFPAVPTAWVGRPPELYEVERWLRRYGRAVRHLTGVSILLTIAVVGYQLSGRLLAQSVCLVLSWGTLLFAWPLLNDLRRRRRKGLWILLAPVVGSLAGIGEPPTMLALLAVAQLVLLILLVAREPETLELLPELYNHPSRLIGVSFVSVILIGTLLLTFPAAAGDRPVGALDALFTATSATCVTGLITLDTPTDFSTFGHVVILVLIQVGGLGIMVLSTFAMLLLGGSLGLRGERALSEILDLPTPATAYRLSRFIVLSTLTFEAVGAAGLTVYYHRAGFPLLGALWRGVFHAVSAFCNAGFALQSDSIVMFQRQPGALLIFVALITMGGLGFVVLASLWGALFQGSGPRPALTAQLRVVLGVSAVLTAFATLLFVTTEWEKSLHGLPSGLKVLNGLLQGVTLRTAGFNSIDLTPLAPATVLAMMVFMFVGASPGSTGGGIKTTTLAVLLAALRGIVRSGEEPQLFDRRISRDIVDRALAILLVSAAAISIGFFLLLVFERQPFLQLLFETISAFGTVGLSLGATPALGTLGKLTIILLMLVGRIGPLTLALLIGTSAHRRAASRYPEARIMVG